METDKLTNSVSLSVPTTDKSCQFVCTDKPTVFDLINRVPKSSIGGARQCGFWGCRPNLPPCRRQVWAAPPKSALAFATYTTFESPPRSHVFGNTISLNLAEGHPLYGKVTCSPDGYFQALDGSIVLLEFKCPFKRKIVVNKIPALYRDQVQTGLALSGELVTKGLFVDCCFRMCSLFQLGMNLTHNASPHYGPTHKTKTPFPRAWGICILESQRKLNPNQAALLNLGVTTSTAVFTKTMLAISSGELRVYYNRVRVICDSRTKAEELFVLKNAKDQFRRVFLACWGFVSCCFLCLEATRYHRDRGAQEPDLPAID